MASCSLPVTPAAAAPALDPLSAVTNLVVTRVTSSSIHLSWTPAPQTPLKYLIVWQPSKGGVPREVRGDPVQTGLQGGAPRTPPWRKKSRVGGTHLRPQSPQTARGGSRMGPPPARTLCPTPPAPAQVVVEGRASSAELHNLSSRTEYLVSVVPVYQAGVGEGLQGLATTGGWAGVAPG